MKFQIGDKVVCNGNENGRVIAVDQWDGLTFYTIRLWDGFRLVGETQMSEMSLASQQPQRETV